MEKDFDFLEHNKEMLNTGPIFTEVFQSSILLSVELGYRTEIIRDYFISDLIPNKDKFIVTWRKRIFSLTDQELKDKYGRKK